MQPIKINELINSISDSLNRHYIFPDKAENISTYLHKQLRINAYTNLLKDPQKLEKQIAKDIRSVYSDPHLRVQFDPGFNPQVAYHPTVEELQKVKKYWKDNNYSFKKLEVLPGNIGYLSFNLFVDDIKAAKPTIKAALSFLANTDAIILDLRENMGGDPNMVSQVESYFFTQKTEMNSLINRSNNDTIFMYADPFKSDSLSLSMPVYILTSQHTFSGAEDFCYGMQVAKRALIVGETTGGGAHPQMPFSVNQGFVMYIPFARSLNPITHTDWEGTGVNPDVKISASKALSKAQELIFRESLTRTNDPKAKNKYLYLINSLLESEVNEKLQISTLLGYVGDYGGLSVYRNKDKLYCRNDNNGGGITELKQLTNKLFQLDKDAQIEFKKNSQGVVFGINILVNDGNVYEENKMIIKKYNKHD
ncbi:MAG: S41 family peptidase [Bacteroidetes bacterium]|nr:S41 family peptidase [Bacteroidota bacterium]